VDFKEKVDLGVDFKEAKEAIEAISALLAIIANVISRYARRRSVLSTRKRAAS